MLNKYLVSADKKENGERGRKFLVNITPSKNILLKAGTAEYDVVSGLKLANIMVEFCQRLQKLWIIPFKQ
jgi:hypothetical protein